MQLILEIYQRLDNIGCFSNNTRALGVIGGGTDSSLTQNVDTIYKFSIYG